MFSVGDVFAWENFPYKRDSSSEIKRRFFVYVGKTKIFVTPVFLYVITSTTQSQHYNSGGNRAHNNYCKIQAGQFGFEQDSIIDVDFNFYSDVTEDQLKRCTSDITILGKLSEDKLRHLYNLIIKSDRIPKKVKFDIHNGFSMAGIQNLNKLR